MAIRIKSRGGESADQMMRRFKKLCEKEGLTKDIKRKEYFEKPSERRRRAARKAENRRLKAEGCGRSPTAGAGPRPTACERERMRPIFLSGRSVGRR
jgi:small subunit ribosomal protein S21